jgi:hypothetical protein
MFRFPSPLLVTSMLALIIALGGAGYSATGDNFILGLTNSASKQTRLVAPLATPAFRIDNLATGATATGLSIVTNATRPPMVVNSSVKVVNLNADKLDGLSSNQLARVGLGVNNQFGSGATLTDAATVTLQIPQPGFVLLTANLTADSASVACSPCFFHALLRDKSTADASPVMVATIGDGSGTGQEIVMAATWVFPVAPGARTFALQTGPSPDGAAVTSDNPTITAIYVPFDATGGQPASVSQRAAKLGPTMRDGRRAIIH